LRGRRHGGIVVGMGNIIIAGFCVLILACWIIDIAWHIFNDDRDGRI